ncbi:hypothetical protein QUA97_27985, partial [Microcoleus sp. CZ3-B2]|uniref:hypothetical protein n=1 Tax=Microcoleus sp. CZ3-B2 TaxID=2818731 RepID=UPI002FD46627
RGGEGKRGRGERGRGGDGDMGRGRGGEGERGSSLVLWLCLGTYITLALPRHRVREAEPADLRYQEELGNE